MPSSESLPWVVKPLVPESVYTDREELLDYFYQSALKAAHRRSRSTVMLGQRRMGKTEIFKRVVNRLFFTQDPKDPHAVVPVYYSFPDNRWTSPPLPFTISKTLIRYYVGFCTGQPELIENRLTGGGPLPCQSRGRQTKFPFTRPVWTGSGMARRHRAGKTPLFPSGTALEIPRRVSDSDDSTIVMFLDEFQNTRLPQYQFDIVGFHAGGSGVAHLPPLRHRIGHEHPGPGDHRARGLVRPVKTRRSPP